MILGGGEDRWLPPGVPGAYPDNPPKDPTEQSSSDRGNLIERAEGLGYEYVSDRESLQSSRARKLLGLFANEEMFQQRAEGEGDIYEPVVPLDEMTEKALSVVSRDRDGFFLFVEEEAIDEFAHNDNAEKMILAGEALDRTVELAVRFAATHPGTLLVVAGDHETGGLAIENVDEDDESGDDVSAEDGPFPLPGTDLEFTVDWTTDAHTGAATPVTAEGPGARAFARFQRNTDVHDSILAAMRLR